MFSSAVFIAGWLDAGMISNASTVRGCHRLYTLPAHKFRWRRATDPDRARPCSIPHTFASILPLEPRDHSIALHCPKHLDCTLAIRSFLLLLPGAGATPSHSAHIIAWSAKSMCVNVDACIHYKRDTRIITEIGTLRITRSRALVGVRSELYDSVLGPSLQLIMEGLSPSSALCLSSVTCSRCLESRVR
jgi:hypothetical protein